MRFVTFSFAVFTLSCVAACGGSVTQGQGGSTGAGAGTSTTSTSNTGTTTDTGTTTSTTGGGGGPPAGDCKTDADCSPGTCAPLTPGGYLVCLSIPPEATSCSTPMSPQDQCCTSSDCKTGKCYSTAGLGAFCGGPAMEIYNECLADQCAADIDCAASNLPPQICAPTGAFGYPVRACFTAYCKTDADCAAQPGGACATVSEPCCGIAQALACVYPGGCSKNADCGPGNACKLDPVKGTGECESGPIPCPV